MANGRIRGASEWLNVAVAGERQHASHAQQVAMGTLLILKLHLPHEIITAVIVTVTSTPFPPTRAEHTLCPLPVQVRPRLAPGLRPQMQCWSVGWPPPSPSSPPFPSSPPSPPSPPARPPCCCPPGAS